ncbi:MAG: hypothetical protein LKE44_08990 [Eubacterium sp.]|jgi:hypothetical protein|nr:hypothetical protein [Eubacterium sp.]
MDNKNSISAPVSEPEKLERASDEEVTSSSEKFLKKNRKVYEDLARGGQRKSTDPAIDA